MTPRRRFPRADFSLLLILAGVWAVLIPVPLASVPLPVRFISDPAAALQASVGWSLERDGFLLLADREELRSGALLPGSSLAGLEPAEIQARQDRRTRETGRVVVAESRPEILLLAASWAHRLGAALLLDRAAEEELTGSRQVWLLGEVEVPAGAWEPGARVERHADIEEIRAAYGRVWPRQADRIVLVEPGDPYAPACGLVAQLQGAELAASLDAAVRRSPRSLTLCSSPQRLGDRLLLALGARLRPVDGIGVLTGVDRLSCQLLAYRPALYREPRGSRPTAVTVARAANPTAHWTAGIRMESPEGARDLPLTRPGFRDALRGSAYLSFSGHGSPEYLRFGRDPDVLFTVADVPSPLPPSILMVGSCQTFRFWEAPEKSVALGLTRAGAAAFIGFAYSPVEGFLPGQLDGAPALASHPGFPLGRVVRLLNEATERRFARVPFLFLLGDPGLAALAEGPRVVRISGSAIEERFLVRNQERSGWAAFTLPGGGPRGFLALTRAGRTLARIPLSGAAFHKDLIAVPRAGSLDILARVPEGDVEVVLTGPSAVEGWLLAGLQSADYALPFMTASHGFGAQLALAALWLAALLLLARGRAREAWRSHRAALIVFSLACAAAYLAYCLLRWPQVAVTTKALRFEPGSLLVPALAGLASLLTRVTVAHRGRAALLGALAAGFPWLGAGALLAFVVLGGNILMTAHVGGPIWSLGTATPLLATGLAICSLAWPTQSLLLSLERRWKRRFRNRPLMPTPTRPYKAAPVSLTEAAERRSTWPTSQ